MKTITAKRTLSAGITAGVLAAGGLLLAPAGALAAPVAAHEGHGAEKCTVSTAELKWGVKERFRNYVSGSIANGGWTTENGASYETPAFSWPNGTGEVSSDLSEGNLKFTGDIHFTGHDGLMKLDVRDPELVITGPDSAQLVLGMGSTATADAELTYNRIVAAKVDLSGYESGDGSKLTIAAAPVALTSEGAAAFNGDFGDYVAGTEMDALTLSATFDGCDLAASTTTPAATEKPAETAAPEATRPEESSDAPQVPWVPIAIGGVALIAIGVTSGMLLAGRKKPSSN